MKICMNRYRNYNAEGMHFRARSEDFAFVVWKEEVMVPEVGLEPTWALSPPDFESGAYTNFATPAWNFR